MHKEVILLREILSDPAVTQRRLAQVAGLSLGSAHTCLMELYAQGLIEGEGRHKRVTEAGIEYLCPFRVDTAVILAAGFGSRFVPLSFERPKGLIEVFGEPMIEREICLLREAGIREIVVVVGYMKESFEYLTDRYGVRLIFTPEYETRNNISSVYAAREYIRGRNVYLLSSDHYMTSNVFHLYEPHSYYAARHFQGVTSEWTLFCDRSGRIRGVERGGCDSDCMYGPAYLSAEFSSEFIRVLELEYQTPGTEDCYWEDVMADMLSGRASERIARYFSPAEAQVRDIPIYKELFPEGTVYEIESLEELRALDPRYIDESGSEAMRLVSRVLQVPESEIRDIERLKKGMTNQSWLFRVDTVRYISRVPGQGSNILINRREELASYLAVRPLGITEDVVYFDEESGAKISVYFEWSHAADPGHSEEISRCMGLLRFLHESGARVPHSFDIGEKIAFYEELIGVGRIPFGDYSEWTPVRDRLLGLLSSLDVPRVLAHVDAVADNFLIVGDEIKLIDWEYAGMCDPLIDPAMCAIYSYMDEEGARELLSMYLLRVATSEELARFYAYMALGGLLWALWGVYKETLGVSFSDYTLRMYRYFKEYGPRALDINKI